MKKITYLVLALTLFVSCADSKDFVIDGETVTVEPYGWFDSDSKNENIEYKVNIGNIVLDILFVETIVVPIILTGDQLYEPVRVKKGVNKEW